MKKIILAAAISVAMAFTCFAANPESDFDYDLVNKNEVKLLSEQFKELNPTEDYVEITYFNGAKGKDAIIEIPEEIEGCKVIKVKLNLQAKKLIVPPSVVYFSFEGTYYDTKTQIEFRRDKNQYFAWDKADMRYVDEPPTDRKIMFVYSTNQTNDSIYVPRQFTWPKNWIVKYYGGFGDFFEPWKDGWGEPNTIRGNGSTEMPNLEGRGSGEGFEFSLEEGITEIPFNIKVVNKLVLPSSIKTVHALRLDKIHTSPSIYFSGSEKKATIVIPEGAKINFEKGCIAGEDYLSISAKKALQAQGYNF